MASGRREMFPASVPVFKSSHDPSTALGMTKKTKWRRKVAATRSKARWPPEGCRYESEETGVKRRRGPERNVSSDSACV